MDRRIIAALFVLAVAAAAAYMWWNFASQRFEEGVTVGKRAVDIEVPGLDKTRFVLSDHRGEVVIIDFMTIWCPSCEAQREVFKGLEGVDVTIASINVDVNSQPSAEWAAERGVNWFVGSSPEAGRTYDVSYVPTVIVIDKAGVIRYRDGPILLDQLQKLIQQLQ